MKRKGRCGPTACPGLGSPVSGWGQGGSAAVKGGAACWPPRKDPDWFPGTHPSWVWRLSCCLRAPGKQAAGAQSRAAVCPTRLDQLDRERWCRGQALGGTGRAPAALLWAEGGRLQPSGPGLGLKSGTSLVSLRPRGRWCDSGALLQTALEPGSGPCLTWGGGAGRPQVSPRIRQRCARVGSVTPGPWVQVPTGPQTSGGSGG